MIKFSQILADVTYSQEREKVQQALLDAFNAVMPTVENSDDKDWQDGWNACLGELQNNIYNFFNN